MRRILIVRTDRVGDVIMVTPMVRELRKTFPNAFIATLTQPNTKSIFLHNPYLDVSLVDDLRKETFWNVVKEIRKYKFTDGLLVLPTKRAAYQMFLAGIKNRIGVGHIFYEVITLMKSVSRKKYTPLRHEADYCMDLARKIGVVTNNIKPEIFVTGDEKLQSKNFLSSLGVYENDIKIVVHTGSGGSSPNWSESKYFQLIERIFEAFNNTKIKIVLTAREMSDYFLQKIQSLNSDKIINISQRFNDLRDLIKVISNIDVLISSSTGPLHIANALNVGCIGLFCHRPMNCSILWGVYNKNSINLEVSEDYCRKNCSKDKEQCAFENGISIETVIENIHKLIKYKL